MLSPGQMNPLTMALMGITPARAKQRSHMLATQKPPAAPQAPSLQPGRGATVQPAQELVSPEPKAAPTAGPVSPAEAAPPSPSPQPSSRFDNAFGQYRQTNGPNGGRSVNAAPKARRMASGVYEGEPKPQQNPASLRARVGAMTPESVVRMANSSAIRNQPLQSDLMTNLATAATAVYGPGATVKVYSGGQKGSRRAGSRRHNDGNAADLYVYGADGKQIKGDGLAPLAQYWLGSGYGSAGLEMHGGGIHLDNFTQDKLQKGESLSWAYTPHTPEQKAAIQAGLSGTLPDLQNRNAQIASMMPGGPAPGAMMASNNAATQDWLEGGQGASAPNPAPSQGGQPMGPQDAMIAALSGGGGGAQEQRKKKLLEALMSQQMAYQPEMSGAAGPPPQMRAPAPQREVAQAAPIVAGGGGVQSVPFTAPASAESIDRRDSLAQAMLGEGLQQRQIRHPLQGLAQMAQTGVGAVGAWKAGKDADARQQALAQALMGSGGPNLGQLAQVDPMMAFKIQQAQQAQQQAQQAQMAQMAREDQVWQRNRAAELEDYAAKKRLDREYAPPTEQWEPVTLPDGSAGQRNTQTGMVRKIGGAGVNVTNNMPNPGATSVDAEARKKLGTMTGEALGGIQQAALNAGQKRAEVQSLRAALERTPGGFMNAIGQLGSRVGLDLIEGQSEAEYAQGVIRSLAGTLRQPGTGPMTDKDFENFLRQVPSLMNTPQGNQLIMDRIEAIADYDEARGRIVGQLNDPNFPGSVADIQRQIYDLPNPLGGITNEMGGQATGSPMQGNGSPVSNENLEGRTATNPRTGERVVFEGGKWRPVQ